MGVALPRWVWIGAGLLACVAGMVNVVGYLGFEHQAVTHLTGTTTLLGSAMAQGDLRAASHLAVRVSEALVKECGKIVDGIYVGTRKEAGLRAPPESKWKRNGG